MKLGLLAVSSELLREALHLPEGTQIVGCSDHRMLYGEVLLKLTHPDFKELTPGSMIPELQPQLRRQDPVVFEGWYPK